MRLPQGRMMDPDLHQGDTVDEVDVGARQLQSMDISNICITHLVIPAKAGIHHAEIATITKDVGNSDVQPFWLRV